METLRAKYEEHVNGRDLAVIVSEAERIQQAIKSPIAQIAKALISPDLGTANVENWLVGQFQSAEGALKLFTNTDGDLR